MFWNKHDVAGFVLPDISVRGRVSSLKLGPRTDDASSPREPLETEVVLAEFRRLAS